MKIQYKKTSRVVLLTLLLYVQPCFALGNDTGNVLLDVRIPIDSTFYKYKFIFQNPTMFLLALTNTGFSLTKTFPIKPTSIDSFSIGSAKIRVVSATESRIVYNVQYNPQGVNSTINATATLNVNNLARGMLDLTVMSDQLNLIPKAILDKSSSKLHSIFTPATQSSLIQYLNHIADKAVSLNTSDLSAYILIDSYNNAITRGIGVDSGEEISLYEQRYLFLSIIIFAIECILLFFIVYVYKRKN